MNKFRNQEWLNILNNSLKYFIDFKGKMSDIQQLGMLENLIELQNETKELKEEDKEDLKEVLQETLKLLVQAAQYPSPLREVLYRAIERINAYLGGYYYGYPEKYKGKQVKYYQEQLRELDALFQAATALAEESKKQPPNAIAQAELSKRKSIEEKLTEVANSIIRGRMKQWRA